MTLHKHKLRFALPTVLIVVLLVAGACRTPQPARESNAKAESSPQQTVLLDQIFDKYTEAVGGREAVERIKTYTLEGAFEMRGRDLTLPVKIYVKKPDKSLMEIDVPRVGTIRRGTSDGKSWSQTPLTGIRQDAPNELTELERDHDIYLAGGIKNLYQSVRLESKARLNGRDVYIVEGKPREGPAEKMLFDQETGLLLRWDIVRRQPNRPNVFARIYLDDYREIGGVKVPFTIKYFVEPRELILRLNDVEHNVELGDAMFAAPAAR
ncbi:MAG: hypothetical protein WKF74_01695 [Pyrinomonadaceae bacterium]